MNNILARVRGFSKTARKRSCGRKKSDRALAANAEPLPPAIPDPSGRGRGELARSPRSDLAAVGCSGWSRGRGRGAISSASTSIPGQAAENEPDVDEAIT